MQTNAIKIVKGIRCASCMEQVSAAQIKCDHQFKAVVLCLDCARMVDAIQATTPPTTILPDWMIMLDLFNRN